MSNNGFKVISESMVTRIEQDQPHATDVGVWFYLMMKCNYVTQTALSTFTDIGAVLDISDRQAANSCYKLRELGWVDFQVKRGSRKPTQFQILTGWHNNSGSSKSSMRASSDDKVSGRHRNYFDETSMRLRCDFDETSMTDTPPGAPGSVPMPVDADLVSSDNTEHEERNMKQQRPRRKEGNVEYPDDKDVVVSNFCYEEDNSAWFTPVNPPCPPLGKGGTSPDLARKENPYVAELCELFANSYGQSLPENKAQECSQGSPTPRAYGILEYGINRCKEVITKGNSDPDNPIGYMQKALAENWQFKDHRAKQAFGIATPSVSATRALIDDLKAMWAAHQNPTAEEIAEVDAMLINAGLKDPPKFDLNSREDPFQIHDLVGDESVTLGTF